MTWIFAPSLMDIVFFMLLLFVILGFCLTLQSPLWRSAYHRLAQSPLAIVSSGIILVYLSVAILDSIRFEHPPHAKPLTLLDHLLSPTLTARESGYSAPFAAQVLSPILSSDAEGHFHQEQPRLKSEYHLFGTDKIGRDVFYLSLKSIRTGFLVGGLTLSIALPLAILFGLSAGYYGRRVDDLIQFFYTIISSIPGVPLIAAGVLAFQAQFEVANEQRLLLICIVLGGTGWIGLCRLLRAETLKIRELEYVQATQLLGYSSYYLLSKCIFPNLFHLILITAALEFSGLVLTEAILSYIGIGLDASSFSWGILINSARLELSRDPIVWWTLTAALSLMFGLVLAINLFADELQKTLDPRRRYA